MTVPGVAWVRPPAVAGLFYPDDPDELRATVRHHLDGAASAAVLAPTEIPSGGTVEALIAPHAGYRYSGPTAASGWMALAGGVAAPERVVLAGPAHRVPVGPPGVGISSAAAWRTPAGDVPVDADVGAALVEAGLAVVADGAHAPEHSLEVHLPFLLELFGPVPVVPLLVGGRCPPERAAEALGRAWDLPGTVVVVSSDLSHYLPDAEARACDERTLGAIVGGRVGDVGVDDACGRAAIAGLMVAARTRGVAPVVVAVATSADTAGDAGRVVGYASVAYIAPVAPTHEERAWLVERARSAVVARATTEAGDAAGYGGLAGDDVTGRRDHGVPPRLRLLGASFVTVRRAGELAGCIGSLEAVQPLWLDVERNARAAAGDDPRFPPLTADDVDDLAITVSVLSRTESVPAHPDGLRAALRPGTDGLVVEADGRRGTFLPSVWRTMPEVDGFLRALLAKAGLPDDPWPADLRAWRYTTDEFGS